MSLLRPHARGSVGADDAIAGRFGGGRSSVRISSSQAMSQSVIWAAGRLRADLLSLMPIDVYRKSGAAGINVAAPTPESLTWPSQIADGQPMGMSEWMYSSQVVLDQHGNSVGVIRQTDALGLPRRVDLVAPEDVSYRIRGGQIIEYRINGEKVDSRHIWHERQYTIAGLPVGLSPIAYAALTLSAGISAQQFAHDWFVNGATPSAHLKNEEKTLTAAQAATTKARFLASTGNGEPFVTGKDWTYSAIAGKAAESGFLEQMKYTDQDLCRFMGVPGDMVDVAADGGSITYANITQRNLQLLVMNLGGAVKRREDALSAWTSRPRFVKLNRSAVLAMDDKSRADLIKARIDARTLTPDEGRALEDQAPLEDYQYEQFDRLFGTRNPTQQAQTTGGTS